MKKKQKIILWLSLVGVILLLALINVPRVGTSRAYAERVIKPAATKGRIFAFNIAIDQYKADTGTYPDPVHGLDSLITDTGVENWRGPYLAKKVLPTDHWGNPFHYDVINDVPIVISAGGDGEMDTRDDVETSKRHKLSEPAMGVLCCPENHQIQK